jgi:hypothetical protein
MNSNGKTMRVVAISGSPSDNSKSAAAGRLRKEAVLF